ncbi:hypothetical protein K488DRAFT_92660 [Vararia minispora EC-137]|uniref:Uncharacterized protein n=1 Tax=Vararia minispora EC-137 TaxID=1314806 RepID=A0ACB8Q3Y6_9AGAM|nr:hypothetical protein K488DRAFT_92660 [Vararia minispora EC-137]
MVTLLHLAVYLFLAGLSGFLFNLNTILRFFPSYLSKHHTTLPSPLLSGFVFFLF